MFIGARPPTYGLQRAVKSPYPWFASTGTLPAGSTFTRASNGTQTDSDGTLSTKGVDVARFSYLWNGTIYDGAFLFMEGAATNLVVRSQEINNSAWAKSATLATANTATAPDGTITADTLTSNTATSPHRLWQYPITVAANTVYTWSIYLKANGETTGQVRWSNGTTSAGPFCTFDLSSGTITATGVTGAGATYEDSGIIRLDNGWYRIWVRGQIPTGSTDGCPIVVIRDASFTGDGVSGFYVWGGQLELGSLTSYIPTTTTSANRAQDFLTATDFTTFFPPNFGTAYNATEGTFVIEYYMQKLGAQQGLFQLGGTANDRISLYTNATDQVLLTGIVGGSSVLALATGASAVNTTTLQKTAFAYKENDSQLVHNGTASAVDTSCTIPTVSALSIGALTSGGSPANILIKSIQYYPVRKSQAEMETLTS